MAAEDTFNIGQNINNAQLVAADAAQQVEIDALQVDVAALEAIVPASLTDHGILVGSGSGPITPITPLTTGQVLVGVTGADPAAGSLSGIAGTASLSQLPAGVARPLSGTIAAAAVGSGATINVALPANSILHAVRVKTTTAFSGAGVAAAAVDVGIQGALDAFINDYDLIPAVSNTNLALNTGTATTGAVGIWGQGTVAAYNVIFTFTADATVTAGVLAYDIFYTPMS